MTADALHAEVVIAGGGLAGIVTAAECLRAGLQVTVVDRDTPERLGGLALWAFGGLMKDPGCRAPGRLPIAAAGPSPSMGPAAATRRACEMCT